MILLATAVQLSLPLGIRMLFDQMLLSGQLRTLNLIALALLGLFILRATFSFVGTYVLHITGDRIITDLRERLLRHMHSLGLRYFSHQRVGDLTSRLSSDASSLREAVTEMLVASILNIFLLTGSIAVMLAMNWRLSLIVLATAPVATYISRAFSPRFQEVATRLQDQLARATAVAQESLAAILLVKSYARNRHEGDRYGSAIEKVYTASVTMRRLNAVFTSLITFIGSASTIAIFWFGGIEVLGGRLTAGALVAFLLYSQSITQSFNQLSQLYAALNRVAGASQRVFEILDTKPEIDDLADAVPLQSAIGKVQFADVSFSYEEEREVLHSIDFEVEPGQTVALVGPSGAGKSTLLSLIPRLYDASHGEVRIDGRDVREYQLQTLREQIAVVTQEVFLFGLSVRDNIRYGRLDASDEEVEAAAQAANAYQFIAQMTHGFDTEVGERGVRLSGGERQRISIARALLKNAPILLLDEATSSVDATSEALIQEAVERLRKRRTTFVIAHRLATVRNADRILVMDGGSIVESGSHEELLLQHGLYHQLVQTQLREKDDRQPQTTPVEEVA
jgi:subfamily B ATP-binding cassette protein MsbA